MRTVWLALLVGVLAPAGGCGDEDEPANEAPRPAGGLPRTLVEPLRNGGHVLLFRHAATDSGVDTTNDLSDCSRQRNLNAEGRRQSRRIGRSLERLDIPVGRVLASPFCRTRDTARLAFGRVRASRALLSVEFFASPRQARRKGLPHLLRAPPEGGANTALVSHGSAIAAATGVEPEEGHGLIVAPGRGPRGFEVLRSVSPGEWWASRG